MQWYKRFAHNALEGMLELNVKQRGVYGSLIDLLYARDGQVIDHDVRVARMIRVDIRTYKAIKTELMCAGKLWIGEDGFLKVPRLDDTLKNYQDRAEIDETSTRSPRDLFEKTNDFNGPLSRSRTRSRRIERNTSELGPGSEKRTQLNGHNRKSKPQHGQGSKKGRIWLDRGTTEFDAHAADYRNHHHGLDPPLDWNNSGAWFNIKGET